MIFEFLADAFAGVLGELLSEEVRRGREAEANRKRIAAIQAGKEVRIPCALRYVQDDQTTRWRHGRLRLAKGNGAWVPRLKQKPTVTFNRRSAVGRYGRRVGARESLSINRRLAVLSYRVGDHIIELGVRKHDLAILGRVVELPPTNV